MGKNYVDLLVELYEITKGSALAGVLLETVGAAQEHGPLTVRLGINKDRTYSIFAHDADVGKAVTQFMLQRAVPRLYTMPEIPMADFQAMIHNPTIIEALGGEAPCETTVTVWPRLSALEYLRRLAGSLRSEQAEKAETLAARLAEPLCAISEARFRTLLNDVLGWKADQLNAAVEEVGSWRDSV